MFGSTDDDLQLETTGTGSDYYYDGVVKTSSPNRYYKRTGSLVGYTGHFQHQQEEEHILESPNRKLMIRGYTGHRPHLKNLCGEPLIPNEETQKKRLGITESRNNNEEEEDGPTQGENFNFRVFAKHMDILERYSTAVQALLERGQTQETLLRIVQAKMSERVNSYALQLIRTRKLFEAFDISGDGVLDEGEFRICLEKLNIQFDDVQNLALFAYFDDNNDGFVEWEDFADHAMVHNPKGGTAVLPKMITEKAKTDNFVHSKSRKEQDFRPSSSGTSKRK